MAARSGHGVVVGASMAGLMAARVLANHFEAVTVVERDVLPEGPASMVITYRPGMKGSSRSRRVCPSTTSHR